jgi:enoyl-CoA hydratase
MKFNFVQVDIRGDIAVFIINDPPANTLTYDLVVQLEQAYLEITLNPTIRAIVITGQGERFFSGGVNIGMLQSVTPHYNSNFILHAAEVLERIEKSPLVIVAAINGHITGGGLELALIADKRIAVDGNYNFGFPEVRLGVIPGLGGTQRLLRLAGSRLALELITQGAFLSVAQARSMGIVDEVVPKEDFLERAIAYTRAAIKTDESQEKRALRTAWKMPDKSIVTYRRIGAIGTITFGRACGSAETLETIWALNEAILEARLDERAEAVFLVHEGAEFHLGNDTEIDEFVWEYADFVFGRLENNPRLCVMAFEGSLGTLEGELALACDYRFTYSPSSAASIRFEGRSRRRSRYASDLALDGQEESTLSLDELVDRGMIKIAESSAWREWVSKWMERFVPPQGASMAIGYAKLAVVKGSSLSVEAGMVIERHLQEQLFRSHDGPEGMKAYLEKRSPRFQGE